MMGYYDINWSKEQSDIINSHERRILVSASAGSGKTTVMIARILRLIMDGEKLENMLICTFTKAAASDMRAKLYKELVGCISSGKTDEIKKERLRTALKGLSRADISTIDSFCQRLVSKYFYMIGVDPQFEVLDESEAGAMKAACIGETIDGCVDPDFVTLKTVLSSKRSNDRLSDAIFDLIEFDGINPAPARYDYGDDVMKRCDEYLAARKRELTDAAYFLLGSGDEKFLSATIDYLETGKKNFPRGKNAKCDVCDGLEHLKKRIGEYHKLVAKFGDAVPQSRSEKSIKALLLAAERAKELYSAQKQKRAAVDFSDLERYALEILRQGKEEVAAKYRNVFVDEYQDINPLQEELISLVAADADLFMVGDLKQSIYAFRGCEPRFFKEKYDEFKAGRGGKAFDLTHNYRSGTSVIDFVNKMFSAVMTEKFGGADYIKHPMEAKCGNEGAAVLHAIKGCSQDRIYAEGTYSVKDHSYDKTKKKDAEAALVVNRVCELIVGGESPSDIAILTRKLKGADRIAELLKDNSIPVSLSERAYYLERPVTGQLIWFLRAIDNRQDDKAVAMSMLSPLGGFDENELAKIRLSGDDSFFAQAEKQAESDDRVKAFFDKLDRYCEMSKRMSVDELSGAIVSECGYFNYAFGIGESAAETLDRFLEFLGGLPCKSSLCATLKYIDERNPFVELSGGGDAVRIMTAHKSKGLEFKHVLVAGISEKFNADDFTKPIFVGKRVSMDVFEDRTQYNSDLILLSRCEQKKKQLEEELRILYVALTRARETLDVYITLPESDVSDVFAAYGPKVVDLSNAYTASSWFAPLIPLSRLYEMSEISAVAAERYKTLFAKADEGLVEELKRYFAFSAPDKRPSKSYVSKLAHGEDDPLSDEREPVVLFADEEETGGKERGSAYHRCLEKIDFSSPDLSVVSEEDRAVVDERKISTAAKNMLGFVGKVYKEKPFILKLKASEVGLSGEGNILVQGVIDLLIVNGNEATVIDYKTGRSGGAFENGYFKQVNLYALAVERLLSLSVTGKYLYYIDEEKFVEVK